MSQANNIPYGYCECGCGGLAPIARSNHKRAGHVKGQPVRFLPNHNTRKHPPYTGPAVKLCECGCGEPTAVAKSAGYGYRKGEPRRFIAGHAARLQPTTDIEAQLAERTKAADDLSPNGMSGCIIWTGRTALAPKNRFPYGYMKVAGRAVRTHRAAWILANGPIPDGLHLDHLCRRTLCCNPDHLEPVTCAENARRGEAAKLTRVQADEVRALCSFGWGVADVGAAFGISKSQVRRIASSKCWA